MSRKPYEMPNVPEGDSAKTTSARAAELTSTFRHPSDSDDNYGAGSRPFDDAMKQCISEAWFAVNGSTVPVFRQKIPAGGQHLRTSHVFGKKKLRIPRSSSPAMLWNIATEIDEDTFAHSDQPEKAETAEQNRTEFAKLMTEVGRFVAKRLAKTDFIAHDDLPRSVVERIGLELYNFGARIENDQTPVVTDLAKIPDENQADETATNTPEQRELRAEKFLQKLFLRERFGCKPIKIAGETDEQQIEARETWRLAMLRHIGFIGAKALSASDADRPKFADLIDNPAKTTIFTFIDRMIKNLDDTAVRPEQEIDSAALRRGMESLKKAMLVDGQAIYDKIGIADWKAKLATLRAAVNAAESESDEYIEKLAELERAEIQLADKIRRRVASIECKDLSNFPTGMIANQEINCVGASLLGGTLLDAAGMDYRVIGMSEHSVLLIVTSGGRLLWWDMRDRQGGADQELTLENFSGGEAEFNAILANPKACGVVTVSNLGYDHLKMKGEFPANILPKELGQQAQIYDTLGNTLSIQGYYGVAIEVYRKGLGIDPDSMATWYNLATTFLLQGDHDAAIEARRKAQVINPEHQLTSKIDNLTILRAKALRQQYQS